MNLKPPPFNPVDLYKSNSIPEKMLLVMYINIHSKSEEIARNYITQIRNSQDVKSLKKTYEVLILPVRDQETKIEVFSREKIKKGEINLNNDKLQELQDLIKK